jgi:hypothetical protein
VHWLAEEVSQRARSQHSLGPRQPEGHVHLAAHLARPDEVLVGLHPVAGASPERAEAEVTVGDRRAHAERAGVGARARCPTLHDQHRWRSRQGAEVTVENIAVERDSAVMRRRTSSKLAQSVGLPCVKPLELGGYTAPSSDPSRPGDSCSTFDR